MFTQFEIIIYSEKWSVPHTTQYYTKQPIGQQCACVLSCYAFLATSMATPRHRQVKRDSESLYDNIYSAIAEFSGTPEEEDPQPQKRSSRFNQGNNAQLNQRDQLPRGVSGRGSPSQPETFLNPNFHTTILKPLEESKDPSGRAVLTQTFLVRPRPTGLGSFSWNQMQLSSPPISKAKLVQLAQTPSVSSLGTFASGIGNKSPGSALPAVASPFPPNLALSHPAQLSFSTLLDPQGQGISHPKSSASTPHFPPLLPFPGRQATTRQVIVDGFPSGLPNGTPKGVVIALASAQNLAPGEMPPIPGEAGVDYPVLTEVPETGFDCNAQTFPGIYADTGADCQVFYMCQPNGNFNGFLCPNGTVFNQQYFICDWWYNFDCGDAQSFYGLNEFIYQDQPSGFQQQSTSLGATNGGFVSGSANGGNLAGNNGGGFASGGNNNNNNNNNNQGTNNRGNSGGFFGGGNNNQANN
eukprot:maker-scaffold201_size263271-snap-gene-1.25 protein:Tk08045 transcript:maker-scaffold201_size263271-snap-gene-1.25-mRNA-1 annotation:"PREDICTED: uncharacterized protein LOC100901383"